MLNKIAFTLILAALPLSACAASNRVDLPNCSYLQNIVDSIAPVDNAEVISEIKSRDADSLEKVSTHSVEFDNGDSARVEQKYCSMYNFSVIYQLKKNTPSSFTIALKNIDQLIPKVNQDYRLKAPLTMIIDRLMNENDYSVDTAFEHALPSMAASSEQYAEHSISFHLTPKSDYQAVINFQFSIGGK